MKTGKVNPKNLKWVDGKIEGVIYRYVLTASDSEVNGWCYIGETTTEEERIKSWRNKGNKSYGGKKCREAREEYGWQAFRYEVLERIYDTDLENLVKRLEEREGYWIEFYDSVQNGFNTSNEGTGQKGVKLTDAGRKQCGDNRRGKPQSEETRKKISDSQKGRIVREETKAKISKGNSGKTRTEEQRKAESERLKGITPIAATLGAKEWCKRNGGGYWKNHTISDEAKSNMKAAQQKRGIKVIATANDGTEQLFPTILDAANALGLGAGSVWNFMRTGGASNDGHTFRRAV